MFPLRVGPRTALAAISRSPHIYTKQTFNPNPPICRKESAIGKIGFIQEKVCLFINNYIKNFSPSWFCFLGIPMEISGENNCRFGIFKWTVFICQRSIFRKFNYRMLSSYVIWNFNFTLKIARHLRADVFQEG